MRSPVDKDVDEPGRRQRFRQSPVGVGGPALASLAGMSRSHRVPLASAERPIAAAGADGERGWCA